MHLIANIVSLIVLYQCLKICDSQTEKLGKLKKRKLNETNTEHSVEISQSEEREIRKLNKTSIDYSEETSHSEELEIWKSNETSIEYSEETNHSDEDDFDLSVSESEAARINLQYEKYNAMIIENRAQRTKVKYGSEFNHVPDSKLKKSKREIKKAKKAKRRQNMSKKNTKQVQEKLEPSQVGPITVDKSGDVVIKINAKPGAKNNDITGISPEGVGVRINAPPTDGEANAELIKYLSKVLGLRKSDLTLDRGSRSRSKTITIHDKSLSVKDITEKLNKEIQET